MKIKRKKRYLYVRCNTGIFQTHLHVCNKHDNFFFVVVVVMRSFYLLLIKWFFFLFCFFIVICELYLCCFFFFFFFPCCFSLSKGFLWANISWFRKANYSFQVSLGRELHGFSDLMCVCYTSLLPVNTPFLALHILQIDCALILILSLVIRDH